MNNAYNLIIDNNIVYETIRKYWRRLSRFSLSPLFIYAFFIIHLIRIHQFLFHHWQ